jgi:hypothetical protein
MRNQIAALFLTVTALTGCTAVDDLTDGNPRASGGAGYMVAVEPGEDLDAVRLMWFIPLKPFLFRRPRHIG